MMDINRIKLAGISLLLFASCATTGPEEPSVATTPAATDTETNQNDPENALNTERWDIEFGNSGINQLTFPGDPHQANVLSGNLGTVDVVYQFGTGDQLRIPTGGRQRQIDVENQEVTYIDERHDRPFRRVQTFRINGDALEWNVDVQNMTEYPVKIGDVSISFPWRTSGGGATAIFEQTFTKKHFISGDGSFMIFTKGGGAPPYLLLTVQPGTRLEYFDGGGGGSYNAYVHSGFSGNEQTEGTWRLEHTSLDLEPNGSGNDSFSYGFRLFWAESYDELRQILADNDMIDVEVAPGMTVPQGLEAKFSLHTKSSIDAVTAEFPDQTEINYLGESVSSPDHHLYSVQFHRLGENMITVEFDGGRETHLEFFSTEPIQTLMDKRRDFMVENQQHRNPDVWYDGLFSVWDMKNEVLRGPDNPDVYTHWWGYVLAADDPALGMAPYLASLNALYPKQKEIEAIEYYLENFVWGGLQRTDEQDPYPYGIYGTPNWYTASDPVGRLGIETENHDRMKVWRAYDYPHIFMLYYHMYQIADRYPEMVNYLDAEGYLERLIGTAVAFFEYPYEIIPYYRIYEQGYYNEMLIPEIIELLEELDRQDVADFLRREWEKKVLFHTYSHPYPYGSEYAFDRTAFESTFAFARYGATHDIEGGENLWYDQNRDMWHSYDEVNREDVREFMDRQHSANIATRGWMEPKFFLMGSDMIRHSHTHILSYMAKMGGWSILNYGLEFSDEPHDWIQLGYNSYLSSFALMNTGTEESDYGFWFPGEVNDGALGWAFMESKHGNAWNRQQEDRGAWRYDGEINLGMGTVTRLASTILTEDPIFGWTSYGANLERSGGEFLMVPQDGVRVRFWLVDENSHIGLHLDRDGWAKNEPIRVSQDRNRVTLEIENRFGTSHTTRLSLQIHDGESWTASLDGSPLAPVRTTDRGEFVRVLYDLPISADQHRLEMVKSSN
ncbi:MAG: DUF5695 domain-containing protein [Balneolaceae bacterium]